MTDQGGTDLPDEPLVPDDLSAPPIVPTDAGRPRSSRSGGGSGGSGSSRSSGSAGSAGSSGGSAKRQPFGPLLILGVLAVVVGFALVVAAAAGVGSGSSRTDSVGPEGVNDPKDAVTATGPVSTLPADAELPEVDGPFAAGRTPIPGFNEVQIKVVAADGEGNLFCVLLAKTDEQRRRGLMGITDPTLGGYDGMLFEFAEPTTGGFWMRNTPMELTIAYIDAKGDLVNTQDMAPCGDSADCPSYPPDREYRRALEVPRDRFADIGVVPGRRLEVRGSCDPKPTEPD